MKALELSIEFVRSAKQTHPAGDEIVDDCSLGGWGRGGTFLGKQVMSSDSWRDPGSPRLSCLSGAWFPLYREEN